MKSYLLSKSTYIRGVQCLKSLYLNKNRPYLRDKLSDEQLAKFARGHQVGKIAQQLFPYGIEMPRPGVAAAEKTVKLISEGYPVIYEACFITNEVIIAIDILVNTLEGWEAYEVKSSFSLSETYFKDAFLQDFVIRGSGLNLKKLFLVHRNQDIEYSPSIDVKELFIFTELPPVSLEVKARIERDLFVMKETLILKNSPPIRPGKQCMLPYPCDFRGLCWKDLSEEEKAELMGG